MDDAQMATTTTSPEPPLPPFLTVREAAALLRLNPKTLYAAVLAGQLRHVRVGRKILIKRDAIMGAPAASP